MLGHKALKWIENKATGKGPRSCVECTLGEGYVADGASITALQNGYQKDFGVTDYEDYSFIFESKVSRSDFMHTFKHRQHAGDRLIPRANFHFIVTTKGIVTLDEIPEFWGWLVESGHGLRMEKMATLCPQSKEHLYEFAYRILRHTTAWKNYNVDRFNQIDKLLNWVQP